MRAFSRQLLQCLGFYAEEADNGEALIGEDFSEESGFEADGSFGPKEAVHGFTNQREDGGVAAPFDEFETAMALGEVPKVPVIPTLEVAFVDEAEVKAAFEHPVEEAKVWNGQDDVGAGDTGEVSERFDRAWGEF